MTNNKNETRSTKPRTKPAAFYKYLYEILPEYWNSRKWGPVPSLGMIKADHEFDAKRKAYDRGYIPVQDMSWAKAVIVKEFARPVDK